MIPIILQSPESLSEIQGSNVTLTCSATGFPLPTLLWTFTNGASDTVNLASTRIMSLDGRIVNELDLVNVIEEHVGTYSCLAINIFDVASSSATLVLQSGKLANIIMRMQVAA